MKVRKIQHILLPILFTGMLTSCNFSYTHPITQEAAKQIISNTKTAISKKDFDSFAGITLTSSLVEYRTYSSFSKSTFLKANYEITYTASPFSVLIKETYENKEDMKTKYSDAEYTISMGASNFEISINGSEKENVNQEKYQRFWSFCNFSSYIKEVSQGLVNKADTLINSVGSAGENKQNKLVGFQTSSQGDDDLKIEFLGSDFSAGSLFFEDNYNADTASELNMYMNGGLIKKYSTAYVFAINEDSDYYLAGKYEGKIEHSLTYIE